MSGTGKKKALDTLATLSRVKSGGSFLPLGVAFNPHVGGALDPAGGDAGRDEEWARLQNKLRSGVVSEVLHEWRTKLHFSGSESYYTACSLLVILKNSRSKLDCQQGFNLNPFSYKIRANKSKRVVSQGYNLGEALDNRVPFEMVLPRGAAALREMYALSQTVD